MSLSRRFFRAFLTQGSVNSIEGRTCGFDAEKAQAPAD
jgi:hypothetical protein